MMRTSLTLLVLNLLISSNIWAGAPESATGISTSCSKIFSASSSSSSEVNLAEFTKAFPDELPSAIFRGFAHGELSVNSVVQMLFGDRSKELRSKSYQKFLKKYLDEGWELPLAIEKADVETAKAILTDLKNLGPIRFFWNQRKASYTNLPRAERTAAVLFAGTAITAFSYAKDTLRQIHEGDNAGDTKSLRLFVLEIDPQKAPVAAPDVDDLMIASHLPSRAIKKIYIGYPHLDANGAKQNLDITWLALIPQRNSSSEMTERLDIYKAHFSKIQLGLEISGAPLGQISSPGQGLIFDKQAADFFNELGVLPVGLVGIGL